MNLLFFLISDSPEGNKVENNGDNEDNNKSQPGEEGNAEVEHILNTLQHMGQEPQVSLEY